MVSIVDTFAPDREISAESCQEARQCILNGFPSSAFVSESPSQYWRQHMGACRLLRLQIKSDHTQKYRLVQIVRRWVFYQLPKTALEQHTGEYNQPYCLFQPR